MSEIRFAINNLLGGDECPLYHRYSSECKPEGAYVQLSEGGLVSAGIASGDGLPVRVFNNCDLRWEVPPEVNGKVLADFLRSTDVRALLDTIWYGHDVDWSNGNQVGTLDDEAQEAYDELQYLLSEICESECNPSSVWEVSEYLFGSNSLRDVWSSESLDAAVANIEADAKYQNVFIDGDIAECLLDSAMNHIEEEERGLTQSHLNELVNHERITKQIAADYKKKFLSKRG